MSRFPEIVDAPGGGAGVDPSCPAERSVVLRYLPALRFGDGDAEDAALKARLRQTSAREGARIFPLLRHRGVEVHVLDETTLMRTGTLKSIDGCVTTARCLLAGHRAVVFESGGNTGTALTVYGRRAGLETYFFVPEDNLYLLGSEPFADDPGAHLIAVSDRGLVKRAARLFGERRGCAFAPETAWRYEASMFRGLFIAEQIAAHGGFDWLSQTISAAFGPVGIYRVLRHFGHRPRFLGVQQQANCPMYRAYKAEAEAPEERGLLADVMYDVKPLTHGTYDALVDVLDASGGDLERIGRAEFSALMRRELDGAPVLDRLGDHGVAIDLVGGEVREKAGLIALAGMIKAIDEGRIAEGSRVLCSLTGGAAAADGRARPELTIHTLDDLERLD